MRKLLRPDRSWEPLYDMAPQPRYEYAIIREPVGRFQRIWAGMREAYAAQRRGGNLIWPRQGVFMWKGFAETGARPVSRGEYDPREQRDAIFHAVLNLEPDEPEDLLRFVNQWGVLGVENPVMAWNSQLFPFDGVADMAQWVRMRQRWMAAYKALRREEPPLWATIVNEFGPGFRDGVATLLPAQDALVTWPLMASALQHLVGPLQHGVIAEGERLRPVYRLDSLAALFNIELWHHVTAGKEIRRCAGCRDYFVPSRPNQAYHSEDCGNKTRQQRWRDGQRTKKPRTRMGGASARTG